MIRVIRQFSDVPFLRLRGWSGKVEEGKIIALCIEERECQREGAHEVYMCAFLSSNRTPIVLCVYNNNYPHVPVAATCSQF